MNRVDLQCKLLKAMGNMRRRGGPNLHEPLGRLLLLRGVAVRAARRGAGRGGARGEARPRRRAGRRRRADRRGLGRPAPHNALPPLKPCVHPVPSDAPRCKPLFAVRQQTVPQSPHAPLVPMHGKTIMAGTGRRAQAACILIDEVWLCDQKVWGLWWRVLGCGPPLRDARHVVPRARAGRRASRAPAAAHALTQPLLLRLHRHMQVTTRLVRTCLASERK